MAQTNPNQPRIALRIEETRDNDTFHLTGHFQHADDNGRFIDFYSYQYGYKYHFDGLTASASGYDWKDAANRQCHPDPVNYRHINSWLSADTVDLMASTFKRIDSAAKADEKRDGPAQSNGQYFLRLARALGADCFILRNPTYGTWDEYNLVEGCRRIDYLVRSWEIRETVPAIAN